MWAGGDIVPSKNVDHGLSGHVAGLSLGAFYSGGTGRCRPLLVIISISQRVQ